MALNFKKTYKFAVKSALYISLFAASFLAALMHFFLTIHWDFVIIFAISLFIFAFFVLQYRVERFIYRRVKKIYDDVSLLDSTSFRNKSITTDMATLTREVEKFARDKKNRDRDPKDT